MKPSPTTSPSPPKPADIRLVAIDLDGTLLNNEKRVSPQTVDALKCLPSRNVKVVIASARPPRSVRAIYQQLELNTWTINYNGALIWDEPNQRAVYHRPIAGPLVLQMIQQARDMFEEVIVACEIMDKWYTDRDDRSFTTETGKIFKKPDVICDVEAICANHITKLMFLGDPRIMMRLEPLLLEAFGEQVTIVNQDTDLIQIMDKRVGKGAALQKVAAHYGVHPKQIMAIGDAPNDVGMLQLAGVAVAMDNAHAAVKAVSHWVAPSNNDHGVHAALVRFGLCQ